MSLGWSSVRELIVNLQGFVSSAPNSEPLVASVRMLVRQSLERSLTQACPYCAGSGRIKSNTTVALEIWRELMKLRDLHEGQDVIVRVNPVVYSSMQPTDPIFEETERNLGIHLVFKPDDSLHHEQFDVMRI